MFSLSRAAAGRRKRRVDLVDFESRLESSQQLEQPTFSQDWPGPLSRKNG